jgi:hypothetical protein
MPVQCLARSGCRISNVLTSGNTLNVSASINTVSAAAAEEAVCEASQHASCDEPPLLRLETMGSHVVQYVTLADLHLVCLCAVQHHSQPGPGLQVTTPSQQSPAHLTCIPVLLPTSTPCLWLFP